MKPQNSICGAVEVLPSWYTAWCQHGASLEVQLALEFEGCRSHGLSLARERLSDHHYRSFRDDHPERHFSPMCVNTVDRG